MAKVFYYYRTNTGTPVTNMSEFGIVVNASTYNSGNELRFTKDFVGSMVMEGTVTKQRFNGVSGNLSKFGLASGSSASGEARIYPAGIYSFDTASTQDSAAYIVGTFLE